MIELKTALEAAGLPPIGSKAKEDVEAKEKSPTLTDEIMKGAQEQGLTGTTVALAAAHSQREEYTVKEVVVVSSNDEEPRGFDLMPIEDSETATKLNESVDVDEIIEDVKRIESELKHAVRSAKDSVKGKTKKLAVRFPGGGGGVPATTRTVELRRSLLKSTSPKGSKSRSANSRYAGGTKRANKEEEDAALRRTVTLGSELQEENGNVSVALSRELPSRPTVTTVGGDCDKCIALESELAKRESFWARREEENRASWEERIVELKRELYLTQAKVDN